MTFKRQLNVQKTGGMVPTLFRTWKMWSAGEYLMAEYISTQAKTFNGKPTVEHRCKVLECNFTVLQKDGTQVDPTGKILTLNAAGTINKLLEGAEKGQVFQFVYEGKHRGSNPKDTQEYHTFSDVALGEVDSEDSGEDYGL